MSETTTPPTELSLFDLRDDTSASKVFRAALGGGDASETRRARALIRQHPDTALQRLQNRGAAGLQPYAEHKILDEVIGDLTPDAARAVMHDHLHESRLSEIVAASSDRPSIAALYAPIHVVIAAMLADMGDSFTDVEGKRHIRVSPVFMVRAWAMKLKDRSDFRAILDTHIGGLDIESWLYVSILFERMAQADELDDIGDFEDPELSFIHVIFEEHHIEADLDEVGLSLNLDVLDRVKSYLRSHDLPNLDDIEEAQRELAERQKDKEDNLLAQQTKNVAKTTDIG